MPEPFLRKVPGQVQQNPGWSQERNPLLAGDLVRIEVAAPVDGHGPGLGDTAAVEHEPMVSSAVSAHHFKVPAMPVNSPDIGRGPAGKYGPASRHQGCRHARGQPALDPPADRVDGTSGGKQPARLGPAADHGPGETRVDQLRVGDQPELAGGNRLDRRLDFDLACHSPSLPG